MGMEFFAIGVAKTPYTDWAPEQPLARDSADEAFQIILKPEYADGLFELERFRYVYVVSYLNRPEGSLGLRVAPPWAHGRSVGLWASRSPVRPNPLGISVVRLHQVEGHRLVTSPLDLFDGTPVLDVKPYFGSIDAKNDANDGWVEDLKDHHHVLQHLLGTAHDHGGPDHSPHRH